MFPYSAQPFSSIAKANFAAFLSVSGRFASGVQQLTELNIQTVKTVIDESNSLLRAGEEASPGDVLGWQSIMLAQLPQKAASYGRHFLSIITSTEADIVSDVRSQYERTGSDVKDALDSAAQEVQSAAETQGAIISDVTDTMAGAAEENTNVILDASGDLARKTSDAGAQATDIAEAATARAKSAAKR